MNKDITEELDFLLQRLTALHEVEDLALQGEPGLLKDLRKLYRSTLRQLRTLLRRFLRQRISMGARGREVSIELLEMIFIRLMDQAEREEARAAKYRGVKGKRPRAEAKEIRKMARSAARALKTAAVRLGRWDEAYAAEYGLNNWL